MQKAHLRVVSRGRLETCEERTAHLWTRPTSGLNGEQIGVAAEEAFRRRAPGVHMFALSALHRSAVLVALYISVTKYRQNGFKCQQVKAKKYKLISDRIILNIEPQNVDFRMSKVLSDPSTFGNSCSLFDIQKIPSTKVTNAIAQEGFPRRLRAPGASRARRQRA